jgi:hypothetical protein
MLLRTYHRQHTSLYKLRIATFHKPTLLANHLESYLSVLERWLREWRLAINVSKSTAMIFARAGWRFFKPRPTAVRGASSIHGFNALSGGDSRYAADLVASNRSGQKEKAA